MAGEYLERTINFHKIYESEVLPIFEAYEPYRRKQALKTELCMALRWILPLSYFLAFALPYIFPPLQNILMDFFVPLVFVLGLGPFFIVLGMFFLTKYINKEKEGFALTLKTDCLKHLLKVFGDIERVNDETKRSIIDAGDLTDCGLFAHYNKRQVDDVFQGTYKGVPFKISEANLTWESGCGKNKHYVTVFRGVIISFKFNKPIKERVVVATKGDLTAKNGDLLYLLPFVPVLFKLTGHYSTTMCILMIIILVSGIIGFKLIKNSVKPSGKTIRDMEKLAKKLNDKELYMEAQKMKSDLKRSQFESVVLEDPEFCRKYNVFSANQVEARYLLTTAFMERFKNLQTVFGAKKAKCAFYDDNLMIAISTHKNLFEIGDLMTPLKNSKSINDFYNELSSIYSMVDYFKLNTKTGL